MDWVKGFDGFHFYDHSAFNDEINSISDFEFVSLVDDREEEPRPQLRIRGFLIRGQGTLGRRFREGLGRGRSGPSLPNSRPRLQFRLYVVDGNVLEWPCVLHNRFPLCSSVIPVVKDVLQSQFGKRAHHRGSQGKHTTTPWTTILYGDLPGSVWPIRGEVLLCVRLSAWVRAA